MRPDDKRKRLPQRWAALADHHRAEICDSIGKSIALRKPSRGLRAKLKGVEKRGGEHRNLLLRSDPDDGPDVKW